MCFRLLLVVCECGYAHCTHAKRRGDTHKHARARFAYRRFLGLDWQKTRLLICGCGSLRVCLQLFNCVRCWGRVPACADMSMLTSLRGDGSTCAHQTNYPQLRAVLCILIQPAMGFCAQILLLLCPISAHVPLCPCTGCVLLCSCTGGRALRLLSPNSTMQMLEIHVLLVF